MHSSRPLVIATFGLAMLIPASSVVAATGTSFVVTDSSWRSIGPLGNLEGTPIGLVGESFENDNIGWNTRIYFDDSAWGDSVSYAGSILGHGAHVTWSDGNFSTGPTPSYFRHVFPIDGTPVSGVLDWAADDDLFSYINGILVASDTDRYATTRYDIDVTSCLVPGENLIAIKAHDSFGGGENIQAALEIQTLPVPEPETYALMLAGLGLVGFAVRRRIQA